MIKIKIIDLEKLRNFIVNNFLFEIILSTKKITFKFLKFEIHLAKQKLRRARNEALYAEQTKQTIQTHKKGAFFRRLRTESSARTTESAAASIESRRASDFSCLSRPKLLVCIHSAALGRVKRGNGRTLTDQTKPIQRPAGPALNQPRKKKRAMFKNGRG